MAERFRLLVIDDEPPIVRLIRASYDGRDAEVLSAEDGEHGIRTVATENPSCILLDLGLPDMDGQEVCRRIREFSQSPIIVLSARGQEKDKILALDNGADDYMTKPFSVNELQARVRVALRHAEQRRGGTADVTFSCRDVVVDLASRRVTRDGTEVRLTPNEYEILALLVRHAGMVVTHRQMLVEVWGPAYAEEVHYLRVYMGQLRSKLEPDPTRPRLLKTEPGVGYRLVAADQ